MTRVSEYLTHRRADQRDVRLWSPLGYHNRKITLLVRRMLEDAGVASGTTILDYGCADKPYASELPRDVQHIGADLEGNPFADVLIGPDGTLPLEDGAVDCVLSTQVLEHVDDPHLYLTESHRVLRPHGSLILSTHGIMYYHRDPVDHWRWTRTGLTKTVEAAGFEVKRLYGMMGLAAAALQLFQDGTHGYVPRIVRPVYTLILQAAIALLDRRYSEEAKIDNGLILAVLATKRPGGAR